MNDPGAGAKTIDPAASAGHATHVVFNQSDELIDLNLYAGDAALREAHAAMSPGLSPKKLAEGQAELAALGSELGSAQVMELGKQANLHPPLLHTHDRFGRRIDEVEFHPAWHTLMAELIRHGTHCEPWVHPGAGQQVKRAARYLMFAQVENGTQCPVTMTYAAMPVIDRHAGLAADWLPKLASREYDPHSRPVDAKVGALIGMGLTEKQGGSDVRSNTSFAVAQGRDAIGDCYRITGHKWFLSAPMCDAFLVLAQTERGTPAGLSCFFMPRFRPDGTRNAIEIQRLKDKLGNRSNASSEVEFRDALAWRVGEVGRGVPTVLEMGNLTRLDCAIGTAGMMRRAVAVAVHHASRRAAFGRTLIDQPLMTNVLADLALESEAATWLALRLARALDDAAGRPGRGREPGRGAGEGREARDPLASALLRVGTPLAKYWVCKRGVALGFEAMEVLGGNGYTEDAPLARIYRELPVNSIWEGSGNVMCLDVLRALEKSPECRAAIEAELLGAAGANRHFDAFVSRLAARLSAPVDEADARSLTEALALALQGSLLVRHAPAAVSDAYCASRLAERAGQWGQTFGTLPAGCDLRAIVERAFSYHSA